VLHLGRAHGARVVRELIRIGGYDAQHDRARRPTRCFRQDGRREANGAPVGTSGPFSPRDKSPHKRGNHETSSSARRTSDPGNQPSVVDSSTETPSSADVGSGTATGG
jgi:hypothetical protein